VKDDEAPQIERLNTLFQENIVYSNEQQTQIKKVGLLNKLVIPINSNWKNYFDVLLLFASL